jgi:hypothetical protein
VVVDTILFLLERLSLETVNLELNIKKGIKANALDHNRPEQFDHLGPVLSACF